MINTALFTSKMVCLGFIKFLSFFTDCLFWFVVLRPCTTFDGYYYYYIIIINMIIIIIIQIGNVE